MNTLGVLVRIKLGDTADQICRLIGENQATKIGLVLEPNFDLVTSQRFLKRLESVMCQHEKTVIFITQKSYFRMLLLRQNFLVEEEIPSVLLEVKIQTLAETFGRVEATPNTWAKKKINLSLPEKVTPKRPQFSTKPIGKTDRAGKSLRGLYFLVFLGVIGLLGVVYFLISPQAEITIKPKISSIETTQNIIVKLAGAAVVEADLSLPSVSGILVQTEIADSQTFPATGREYQVSNAGGAVTLYNETPESKFLLASRLQTDQGVVVRMKDSAMVPPWQDGQAGSLVVDVVADEYDSEGEPIGTRGNLEAGTRLFFPGLRAESRELYYARANQGPLVGGSTLTTYLVAETDFEAAREPFTESLAIRATDSLKTEVESRSNREAKTYVMLEHPELLSTDLVEYEYDEAQAGQEQQTFSVNGKIEQRGLVFDQGEIIKIATRKLRANQDHRKKIVRVDPNSMNYKVIEVEKLDEENWVKLSVSLKGVETLDFEADNEFAKNWQRQIKTEILGQSQKHARGVLLNHPEIENVEDFKLSPFWQKTVPLLLDQVKLRVMY